MALPVDNQESLLQELDFNRILGAPLSACVNAQEEAAQATLQYLNEVVFTQAGDDDSSLEPSPSRSTSSQQDKFIASSCRCSSSCPYLICR